MRHFTLAAVLAISMKSDDIVSHSQLQAWGYQHVNTIKYSRYCNSKVITRASIRYQSIGSIKPMTNSRTYPRYSFVIEFYSNKCT